jgi:Pex2 / Pex12 amino terminal region/Zinc finger, C3HC4 type (RING finger)
MSSSAEVLSCSHRDANQIFAKLLSCSDLNVSLHPALIHVAEILSGSARSPQRTLLSRYHDEIFLLVDLLLNGYYLHYFQSGWAEKVHGLIRRYSENPRSTNLIKSLFSLVIWPYIFRKMEDFLSKFKDERRGPSRVAALALQLYPYLKKFFLLLQIRTAVRFLSNKSPFSSLMLEILDVRLQRRTEKDEEELKSRIRSGSVPFRLIHCLFRNVAWAATVGLLVTQLWSASADEVRSALAAAVPPAPKLPIMDLRVPSGHCPICRNIFVNAMAVKETRIVFCGKCISEYVRVNKRCPFTGNSLSEDSLVKIFHI